jgi:hypothetical protein
MDSKSFPGRGAVAMEACGWQRSQLYTQLENQRSLLVELPADVPTSAKLKAAIVPSAGPNNPNF